MYSVFVHTAGLNTLIMIPVVSLVGVGADSCCFCVCVVCVCVWICPKHPGVFVFTASVHHLVVHAV